jgi:hypothetical protein
MGGSAPPLSAAEVAYLPPLRFRLADAPRGDVRRPDRRRRRNSHAARCFTRPWRTTVNGPPPNSGV